MTKRILAHTNDNHQRLDANQGYRFALNHAMSIYRSNSIYTFIPKNGCSTLRLSLALENGAINSVNEFNWIHNNNQTFTPDLRDVLTADYTFVILRNPLSRLASVYLDKIVSKQQDAWQLRNLYDRNLNLDQITFSSFASLMQQPKFRNSNIHWRPQSDFLIYENYDDYFDMDNFSSIAGTLKSKIDFEIVDSRQFIRHDTSHYDLLEGNFSETPAHEIASLKIQGKCPSHESLYTEKLAEIVGATYREDLVLWKDKCNL